jgi:hypothetical protein
VLSETPERTRVWEPAAVPGPVYVTAIQPLLKLAVFTVNVLQEPRPVAVICCDVDPVQSVVTALAMKKPDGK